MGRPVALSPRGEVMTGEYNDTPETTLTRVKQA
jgi:hypothetical protein